MNDLFLAGVFKTTLPGDRVGPTRLIGRVIHLCGRCIAPETILSIISVCQADRKNSKITSILQEIR